MTTQDKSTVKAHRLTVPDGAGRGVTRWVATCSCGAEWRCEYGRRGLQWYPLNAACESCPHNRPAQPAKRR